MTAFEFFLYCTGISTLIISTGAAVRLVITPFGRRNERSSRREVPVNAADGLENNLRAVLEQRYAAPIIHRTLDDAAGPPRRALGASLSRFRQGGQVAPAPTTQKGPQKKDEGNGS